MTAEKFKEEYSMIINHNLPAMNALRNMSANQANAAKSQEKLSSGFRINRAGDDAAGLAISEKMRGQIRGLDQASRNAQDGISLLQTAEGALNETHSILQRIRELAVQSTNGSLTDEDRSKIQGEANQLIDEIDNIGNQTQFNTKNILNGDVGVQLYAQGTAVTAKDVSNKTLQGVYTLNVTSDATAATISDKAGGFAQAGGTVGAAGAGDIVLNGKTITIAAGDTRAEVLAKINVISNDTGVKAIAGVNGGVLFETESVGKDTTMTLTGAAATLNAIGVTNNAGTGTVVAGADAAAKIDGSDMSASGNELTGVSATGTAAGAEGLNLSLAGTKTAANITLKYATNTTASETLTLNGVNITIAMGADQAAALSTINGQSDKTGVTAVADGANYIKFITNSTGVNAKINVAISTGTVSEGFAAAGGTGIVTVKNKDGVTPDATANTAVPANATVTGSSGIYGASQTATGLLDAQTVNTDGIVRVDTNNELSFHTGANSGQTLNVSINDMRANKLGTGITNDTGITDLYDLKTKTALSSAPKSEDAIKVIDEAITNVSTERAKLGAYQNRLEHTIANLGTSSENLTSAESRIRDVNMAQEMMQFSKNNILSQAAQAMLAQANQAPSGVLQLLK